MVRRQDTRLVKNIITRQHAHLVEWHAREAMNIGGGDGARIGKRGGHEDQHAAEHRRVRGVPVPCWEARVAKER